ncbi:hypothetical protein B7486_15640 [cyanobacterium TDX16]|nr:hypothetical protein B7486_15640 [cyanobacterium TDX16]
MNASNARSLGTSCHKQTLSKDGLMRLLVCLVGFVVLICISRSAQALLVVTYNPYGEVNWTLDRRSLTQLHDHIGTNISQARMYDGAGYNALSVMHYSGVPGHPTAWTSVNWPLSSYVIGYPTDEAFLATCQNLRTLIPNTEQLGGSDHITAPFLLTYICKWSPAYFPQREWWHYVTNQECINLICNNGGMAFIAHPINMPSTTFYNNLTSFAGIEVYSSYFAYNFSSGGSTWDGNARMIVVWDSLLQNRSTLIWGIGVNDWFGPEWDNAGLYPEVKDSGKTLLMIRDWSLEELRHALTRGAFFAVKDIGIVKRQYPVINSISVQSQSVITISTPGSVRWISNGVVVSESSVLNLNTLPLTAVYVRAEVSNEFGTLYTQPFTLGQGTAGDPTNPPELAAVQLFVAEVLNPGPDALRFDANGDKLLDGTDIQVFMDGLMSPPLIRFPSRIYDDSYTAEMDATGCGDDSPICTCHPPG